MYLTKNFQKKDTKLYQRTVLIRENSAIKCFVQKEFEVLSD